MLIKLTKGHSRDEVKNVPDVLAKTLINKGLAELAEPKVKQSKKVKK
jgi:hypothetical protein